MAKSYTFNNRSTGPTNPKAHAVPGGSLATGKTYYYRPYANGYYDFYRDANAWLSACSPEVSAVTDATNRTILIEFDNNVSGTESISAPRTEVSGDYNETDSSGNITGHYCRLLGYRSNHNYDIRVNNSTIYNRYTMTMTAGVTLSEGETLTGVTSGKTAKVVNTDGTTSVRIYNVSGTFTSGEVLNGSVSGSSCATLSGLPSSHNGYVLTDNQSTSPIVFPTYVDGAGCLEFSGGTESDPITLQDMYDYMIATYGSSQEYIVGSPLSLPGSYINTAGNDVCNFFKLNISITDKAGNYYYQKGGTAFSQYMLKHTFMGHSQFGDLNAYGSTDNGTAIIGAWHLAFYNNLAQVGGTTKIYGSMLGMRLDLPGSLVDKDPYYQLSGDMTVTDSIVKSSGRWQGETAFRNTRMMLSGEAGNSICSDDVEGTTFNTAMGSYYSYAQTVFENRKLYKSFNTWSMYVDGNYVYGGCKLLELRNITFANTTYHMRRRASVNSTDFIVNATYGLNLKVQDENGNDDPNAVVYAYDVNGTPLLHEDDWQGRSYTNAGKTGTSIILFSGTLTVGEYYLSGDEIFYVSANPSGSTYTIARAQKGTTANIIGGPASGRTSFFWKVNKDGKAVDSNGEVSRWIKELQYKELDVSDGLYKYVSLAHLGKITLIVKSPGKRTYIDDSFTFYNKKKSDAAGIPIYEPKSMLIQLKTASNTREI